MDYSGARYYSMLAWRFNGDDPFDPSALQSNPQTWNRYSYVLNRPLAALDPYGLLTIISGGTFNGNAKDYGEGTHFAAAVEKSFGDKGRNFIWSGSLFGRRQAAKGLLKFIQYHVKSGEPPNIIALRNGGNIVKAYTQLAGADDIDVFIAPVNTASPGIQNKKG